MGPTLLLPDCCAMPKSSATVIENGAAVTESGVEQMSLVSGIEASWISARNRVPSTESPVSGVERISDVVTEIDVIPLLENESAFLGIGATRVEIPSVMETRDTVTLTSIGTWGNGVSPMPSAADPLGVSFSRSVPLLAPAMRGAWEWEVEADL